MEKFKCDVCQETFLKSGFQRHYRRAHNYENADKCCQCEKVFKNAEDLSTHVTKVHKDSLHKCDNCDCSFVKRRNLTTLKKPEESSHVRSTILKLIDPSSNANGIVQKRDRTVTHFDCNLCGERFLMTNLQRHFRNRHNYESAFVCRSCDKIFEFGNDLSTHLVEVHKFKKFMCDICDQCFTRKESMQSHMAVHSRGHLNYTKHQPKKRRIEPLKMNDSKHAKIETVEVSNNGSVNDNQDSLIKIKDTHHFEHESQIAIKKEVKIEPTEPIIGHDQDFRKEIESLKAETKCLKEDNQHWKTKYQSLQDRVTPLENEVETMKKQIQELLEMKEMLTKKQNQAKIDEANENQEVGIEIKEELTGFEYKV